LKKLLPWFVAAALAGCAGGPDSAPAVSTGTPHGEFILFPTRDTIEMLVEAPNLGWHVGGWYAFQDAPGRRVKILYSVDRKQWEDVNLIDRAGPIFGAVMWNPADGLAIQGTQNKTVLYATNKGFREFRVQQEIPGKYVKLIPERTPDTNGAPSRVYLVGSQANGGASVLRVEPGGAVEEVARFEGATPRHAADLVILGTTRGTPRSFLVGGTEGRGCLYASDDLLNYRKIDVGEIPNLLGIAFDSAGHGIAVGDNGECLRTADGGATWKPSLTGTEKPLASVVFIKEKAALACGRDGLVMLTRDGGVTFQVLPSGRREDFFRLLPSAAGDGAYALGGAGAVPFFTIP
jgi:hypothetical protein